MLQKTNSFWIIISFSSCPHFTPRISVHQCAKCVFFVLTGRGEGESSRLDETKKQ